MANANLTQPSFSSGIISTELFSRIDFSKIASGLKQCENFVVRPAGGAVFRVGTKYLANSLSNEVKLIPFQFDKDTGFCLEFTPNKIRVFLHGVLTEANITSPFYDVSDLKYVQSKNTLYILSSNVSPHVLKYDNGLWSIRSMNFNPTLAQPTAVTIAKESAKDGDIIVNFDNWQYAVSCVDTEGHESLPVFSNIISSDIDLNNQPIKITITGTGCDHYNVYRIKGGEFYLCYELDYQGQTTELKDISFALDETKSPKESFDAFSIEKPKAIGIWNQRLILGNTTSKPDAIWGSRVDDFEDFTSSPLQADDEGFELTLASNTVDYIRNFVTMDDLIVFTSSKIWRITGTSVRNMSAYVESYNGISDVTPVTTKKSILFVDSSKNTVSNFIYSDELNGYTGQNLDILARELFEGYQINSISYRDNPYSVLYCVRNDGVLLGLTYMREENIYAWHKHTTQGRFIDICSVNSSGSDELYCAVRREGNATPLIEQFAEYINAKDTIDDAWHLDCATKIGQDLLSGGISMYQSKKFVDADTTTSVVYEHGGSINTAINLQSSLYEITVVGGGGGSSHGNGGRGGGGTVRVYLPTGKYNIRVGKGGAAASYRARNHDGGDATGTVFSGVDVTISGSGGYGGNAARADHVVNPEVRSFSGVFSQQTSFDLSIINTSGASAKIATSFLDGTMEGWGAGARGGHSSGAGLAGKDGYIKIVKYTINQKEVDDPNGIRYVKQNELSDANVELFYDKTTYLSAGDASVINVERLQQNNKLYYLKARDVVIEETITNLSRFEGQRITIVQNGNVFNFVDVINGSVDVPLENGQILAGLPYEGILETIPMEQKFSSGNTTIGGYRKINDGVISYLRSRGLWYGNRLDKLYEIKPYTQDTYSYPIPLESGKLTLRVADGFNEESTFMVVQRSPFPALIQSITLGMTYNGKS